jgi:L-2,4-diaminobutyrate decarboxylase
MFHPDESTRALAEAVVRYAVWRVNLDPPPLDGPRSPEELAALAGPTITPTGIGGLEALRVFGDVLAPACISVDHPRFLSFVPAAPTDASILFDLVVGASSIYGGSWLEGGGAVFAENEALRWIADLAGLPATAGGVFVSGGTMGNLSALLAARWRWRDEAGGALDRTRGLLLASGGAHSSVAQAARAMDADVVTVPADDVGRLTRDALRSTVESMSVDERERLFAIVVTCGTTNAGVIDDLRAAADVAAELGTWLHVDGAYGGAALAAPSVRDRFAGVEAADSFIVDPHKWLFAPFDSCALIYRDPEIGRAAHTQHAEYLDVLHAEKADTSEAGQLVHDWNASDYAHHLTRRARGLPLWFSLATHGTEHYRAAVEGGILLAQRIADEITARDGLSLVRDPQLSVVVFRREGWTPADYQDWSDRLLEEQKAFVVPSSHAGETVLRFAIISPLTTFETLTEILDTLR